MIAGGEDRGPGDFGEAGEFRQGGALVVVGVAKAKINRVSLIMKLRLARLGLIDEFRDAIHLFLARRDQAGRRIGFVDDSRFGLVADEIDDLSQDRSGGIVELDVGLRAPGIPIAVGFPAVGGGSKDVPLAREDKIGEQREGKIFQTFFEQTHRAAGVDRPDDAAALKFGDQFHAIAIEDRIARMRNERAVEIGADKSNFRGHAEPESRNGFSAAQWIDSRYDLEREKNMKSAYELAMERLEKNAPTVNLTDGQKAQIAEIDSTFKARIAERELFLQGKIREAEQSGNFEELGNLEKQLATELRRLQEDCEEKKAKLRASFAK